MSQPHRKVVSELSKVWDSVIAKGKAGAGSINGGGANLIKDSKSWLADNPTMSSIQTSLGLQVQRLQRISEDISRSGLLPREVVTEGTRIKVGRFMSAYEELIGISEVKKAHERVLLTEAKFIECQEQRRAASETLTEIQNKLTEVRAELDRTQRGDELYLDLIKKEITAIKEERIVRKQFETWERTEREVFAELSNALRFSHEKERAQNEKTKYWSIVGSLIGAALGIIGTTINNRMKQNNLKRVMEQTSAQVAAIQATVENLSQKVSDGSLTNSEISDFVRSLRKHQDELAKQEQLSSSMNESLLLLQTLTKSYGGNGQNSRSGQIVIPTLQNEEVDIKQMIVENKWPISAAVCCIASILLYRFS